VEEERGGVEVGEEVREIATVDSGGREELGKIMRWEEVWREGSGGVGGGGCWWGDGR